MKDQATKKQALGHTVTKDTKPGNAIQDPEDAIADGLGFYIARKAKPAAKEFLLKRHFTFHMVDVACGGPAVTAIIFPQAATADSAQECMCHCGFASSIYV